MDRYRSSCNMQEGILTCLPTQTLAPLILLLFTLLFPYCLTLLFLPHATKITVTKICNNDGVTVIQISEVEMLRDILGCINMKVTSSSCALLGCSTLNGKVCLPAFCKIYTITYTLISKSSNYQIQSWPLSK